MPSLTTRKAPPEVAPDTMRMAWPLDLMNALMAGLGPMKLASMAFEKSASVASGPALKVCGSSVTFDPSAWANVPLAMPTIAVAWVTFGK